MATLAELEAAFLKADQAGNRDDARAFASEINRLRNADGQGISSRGGTMTLPANAGLVNLGASIIGLPLDTVQNALNLIKAGVGGVAGAMGREDLMPDLTRNIPGGSENIRNMLRSLDLPGLSPDNPNPSSSFDTAQYDFVSRGGVLPGGALPAATSMVAEKIGGPAWGMVGAVAPSAMSMGYNALRAPMLSGREAQNMTRDVSLRGSSDAGYVWPPSAVNPNALENIAESFGGKTALKQEATLRNQRTTNAIIRRELGLPENSAISEATLERARNRAAEPYRNVASLSTQAASDLQELRQSRFDANLYWRHFDKSGDPQARTAAQSLSARADQLEQSLEQAAQQSGKPDLVNDLRRARVEIAKIRNVERALNVATGDISASVLGGALDRGRLLSGGLRTVGTFAEAMPQYAGEAVRTPTPGVSALNWPMSAALGLEGYRNLGGYGALLAGLPFVRGGVRSSILSGPYQRAFAQPSYNPAMMPENAMQMLLRQGILAGRQEH